MLVSPTATGCNDADRSVARWREVLGAPCTRFADLRRTPARLGPAQGPRKAKHPGRVCLHANGPARSQRLRRLRSSQCDRPMPRLRRRVDNNGSHRPAPIHRPSDTSRHQHRAGAKTAPRWLRLRPAAMPRSAGEVFAMPCARGQYGPSVCIGQGDEFAGVQGRWGSMASICG